MRHGEAQFPAFEEAANFGRGTGLRSLLLLAGPLVPVAHQVLVEEIAVPKAPACVVATLHLLTAALEEGEVVAQDRGPFVLVAELLEMSDIEHCGGREELAVRDVVKEDGEVGD